MHCTLDLELSPEIIHNTPLILKRLLAKGSTNTYSESLSRLRSQQAGFENGAMAAMAAQADGIEVTTGIWLMADPVHLVLQRDAFSLYPEVPVQLTQNEAVEYQAVLNQHFTAYGIAFYLGHSGQWYVHATNANLVASAQEMTHPVHAMGRSIEAFLPSSAEGNAWLQLQNEVQMRLFECGLSQTREQNGQIPVNSVWLYGAGERFEVDMNKPSVECYVSNAPFYRGLAQSSQSRFSDFPQNANALEALLRQRTATKKVVDLTRNPGWEEMLARCEKLVKARMIKQLTLQLGMPNQTLIANVKPIDLLRFWRTPRTITNYL